MILKPITYTQHAATVLLERGIAISWVERVLNLPDWRERDTTDPSLTSAFKTIEEFGGRILRVVYDEARNERRVVTAYFDRTRQRQHGARSS
jgi:hypothetical protein